MSNQVKHTKGPWKRFARVIENSPSDFIIADKAFKGTVIATCNDEANANLIAAAPDLIEAAKLVLDARALGDRDDEAFALGKLQDAIAKAEGK